MQAEGLGFGDDYTVGSLLMLCAAKKDPEAALAVLRQALSHAPP